MKPYEFTTEDINFIIENWGTISMTAIRKHIGCSHAALSKIALKLNLNIPNNNWSKEEECKLLSLASTHTCSEIADIMGKSWDSIYNKSQKMNIKLLPEQRPWTLQDEELLSEYWGLYNVETIAKKLNRTITAVRLKAQRMHLGSIMDSSDVLSIDSICDILKVTRNRVLKIWTSLGLKVKRKKIIEKFYFYVSWPDLLLFLENNQNEWDSRKVEEYMLGPEPEWLKIKRRNDKISNPLFYRQWTLEEMKHLMFLKKTGKSYKEIAKLLDRTESSISNILHKINKKENLEQSLNYEQTKIK